MENIKITQSIYLPSYETNSPSNDINVINALNSIDLMNNNNINYQLYDNNNNQIITNNEYILQGTTTTYNNDYGLNLNNISNKSSISNSTFLNESIYISSLFNNNNNQIDLNSNDPDNELYNMIFNNWGKTDQSLQRNVFNYDNKVNIGYNNFYNTTVSSNNNILVNPIINPNRTKINQNVPNTKNNKTHNVYIWPNQYQPKVDNLIIDKKENNIFVSNPEQISTIPPFPEQSIPPTPEKPITPIPEPPKPPIQNNFYFHLKGLDNIGSTCYMNSTLQCLLHLNNLVSYFLNEYPKDFNLLNERNKNCPTHGNISKAFYDLTKEVYSQKNEAKNNEMIILNNNELIQYYGANNIIGYNNISNYSNSISPSKYHTTIGNFNPQFRNLEANDSKDLILYLFQSMHSELNYLSNNRINLPPPNQYDRANVFNYFVNTYDRQNFSIISKLFYGTYENITKCKNCSKIFYNFQKFEFISFGMFNYNGKDFNIYDGFENNQKVQLLRGDNKSYCNNCKSLNDAEICSKIIVPPNNLLINIDYGKNKMFMPKTINFDEVIDITKYVNFYFGTNIKYQLISVCVHYGDSFGHYVAFCKNKNNNKWYLFNDSECKECDKNEIHYGSPYLLLYERIF